MSLTKASMAESLFNEMGLNKKEARELVDSFFQELEPYSGQSSFLGSEGFLTIQIFPGTAVDRAQDIARYLRNNVYGIGVTTF